MMSRCESENISNNPRIYIAHLYTLEVDTHIQKNSLRQDRHSHCALHPLLFKSHHYHHHKEFISYGIVKFIICYGMTCIFPLKFLKTEMFGHVSAMDFWRFSYIYFIQPTIGVWEDIQGIVIHTRNGQTFVVTHEKVSSEFVKWNTWRTSRCWQ